MTTDTPCTFTAPDKLPCPAYGDDRNTRGHCYAHEQIYLHDCAVSFRRKCRKDKQGAEQWARSQRLDVEAMHAIAAKLPLGEQAIALDVQ